MSIINPKLFIDPKAHYPVPNARLPFNEYRAECEQLIINTRLDLQENKEKIISANTPFEFRPLDGKKPRAGALLIHGLLDSPFLMQDMGRFLQSKGLLVRCILLPGHGTVPGALLHVDYHEWLQTLQYGFTTLAEEVDHIFLVGHSTGAALAFYHTLLDPTKIAGLIMLAPAFKINSAFARLSYLPPTISHLWPRACWFHHDRNETIDYAKYSSLPFNAIYQVFRLTADIKTFSPIKQLTCPLFFALSEDDDIICPNTVIKYFEKHHHPKSQLILYTRSPETMREDYRIVPRNSAYPLDSIRDFSHVCIHIAPDNPHYGIKGDYRYASHIGEGPEIVYGEFSKFQLKLNAWAHRVKLTPKRYQRLSFNPDFDYLTTALGHFIS